MPEKKATSQTGRTVTRSNPQQRVMKDLTSEEMQVLTQIQSELGQLLSMGAGGQQGAPVASGAGGGPGAITMAKGDQERDTAVGGSKVVGPTHRPGSPEPATVEGEAEAEAEAEMDDEPDGDEPERMQTAPANATTSVSSTRKAIIVGDPDASTGSGPAEERIEDLPEWDEENLDQVVKGILRMAMGKGIRKERAMNPLTVTLLQVTKALQELAAQQRSQGTVLTDILDGLGVTKALEQKRAPQQRTARKGLPADQANVANELLSAILSVAKGQGAQGSGTYTAAGDAGASPAERVRKGMADIVMALNQNAGQLWNPPDMGGE